MELHTSDPNILNFNYNRFVIILCCVFILSILLLIFIIKDNSNKEIISDIKNTPQGFIQFREGLFYYPTTNVVKLETEKGLIELLEVTE
jgi:cell shape-determining protein MreC